MAASNVSLDGIKVSYAGDTNTEVDLLCVDFSEKFNNRMAKAIEEQGEFWWWDVPSGVEYGVEVSDTKTTARELIEFDDIYEGAGEHGEGKFLITIKQYTQNNCRWWRECKFTGKRLDGGWEYTVETRSYYLTPDQCREILREYSA